MRLTRVSGIFRIERMPAIDQPAPVALTQRIHILSQTQSVCLLRTCNLHEIHINMPSYLDTLQRSLHQHLPSVIPPPNSASLPPWLLSLALTVPSVLLLTPLVSPAPPKRTSVIKATSERVLIIGASSGCGEDLAKRYASLGASV